MGEFIKEIKDTAVSIKSWVIIIFATIFFAIAAIIISLFGNAEKAQKVARLWGKTIIRLLGINVIASGAENISPENSYIITSIVLIMPSSLPDAKTLFFSLTSIGCKI